MKLQYVHVCFQHNFCTIFFLKHLDGPANCSKMSVMPECRATTNAMGDTNFSITLPTASDLMCVEGYQVHFNGESESVSLSSPSANFTISDGQSVVNEIVVYTLDYENRTGQVPCTYSIPGEFLQMHMILCFANKYSDYTLALRYVTLYLFSHWWKANIYALNSNNKSSALVQFWLFAS